MENKNAIIGNIIVVGRRWFQRTYGNTYHTVTIYVNGESLQTDSVIYGYGEHYKQTAHNLLVKSGYDVPTDYFDFLNLNNVIFDVFDVSKKKEL
jgi:hypothetical protein